MTDVSAWVCLWVHVTWPFHSTRYTSKWKEKQTNCTIWRKYKSIDIGVICNLIRVTAYTVWRWCSRVPWTTNQQTNKQTINIIDNAKRCIVHNMQYYVKCSTLNALIENEINWMNSEKQFKSTLNWLLMTE